MKHALDTEIFINVGPVHSVAITDTRPTLASVLTTVLTPCLLNHSFSTDVDVRRIIVVEASEFHRSPPFQTH